MNNIIKLLENIPGLSITKNGSLFIFQINGETHQHSDFMNGVRAVLNQECKRISSYIDKTEDDLLKLKTRLEILNKLEKSIIPQ